MKRNLGKFFGLSRKCAGAVLLAICGFALVTRADIVINNTANLPASNQTGYQQAELFTMGTSGNINSLTLSLVGTGSREAYIFTTSAGAPSAQLYDLGAITVGQTLSLANLALAGGTTYAVVLDVTGSTTLGWNYTSDGSFVSQNGSSVGGLSFNTGSWAHFNSLNFQMNLQEVAVPEVPITGAVMGVGVLAIAMGRTLRRKLRPTVSSLA